MQKKGKGINSIKVKILVMVILVAAITGVMATVVSITNTRKCFNDIVQELMLTQAKMTGAHLDDLLDIKGAEALTPESLGEIFKDVKIEGFDTSYMYVVSADGTMLYHPTADKIGNKVENAAVSAVVDNLKAGKKVTPEFVKYLYKGANKYAAYYVTSGSEAIVVATTDEKDAISVVLQTRNKAIIVCVLLLIISVIVSIIVTNSSLNPLSYVADRLMDFADMKFKKDHKLNQLSNKNDEVGAIALGAVKVIEAINETVEKLNRGANELNSATEALSSNLGNTVESVNQVESAMNEIATGVTQQAQNTEDCAVNIDTIVDKINKTSDMVSGLNSNAKNMSNAAEQGVSTLADLVSTSKEAIDAINRIYEQAKETNKTVADIKEATELITTINEQTRLLSLNASIEAARAGEAGRGFAVVAQEIQSLSDQTTESANRISETVRSLTDNSNNEMETMALVLKIMSKQNENVDKTNDVFGIVNSEIRESMIGIDEIANGTNEMNNASERIMGIVSELSSTAQDNAASTQETSASVTCITSNMNEIGYHCDNLKNVASQIEEAVGLFEI